MSVGDINSNEQGTGARFNDGKAKLEYIPAAVLHDVFGHRALRDPCETDALIILAALAELEGHSLTEDIAAYLDKANWGDIAAVFEYGAGKYAPWNWAKGMPWSVPVACAKRHCLAVLQNQEVFDQESGLPHLAHAGCNLVMLMYYARYYWRGDDLPKLGPTVSEMDD